jgi:hypothetical protein
VGPIVGCGVGENEYQTEKGRAVGGQERRKEKRREYRDIDVVLRVGVENPLRNGHMGTPVAIHHLTVCSISFSLAPLL